MVLGVVIHQRARRGPDRLRLRLRFLVDAGSSSSACSPASSCSAARPPTPSRPSTATTSAPLLSALAAGNCCLDHKLGGRHGERTLGGGDARWRSAPSASAAWACPRLQRRRRRASIATIQRALELGIDFLDTADAYGRIPTEQLVGRAIADRRDEVVLATSSAMVIREDASRLRRRAAYVHEACDRLGEAARAPTTSTSTTSTAFDPARRSGDRRRDGSGPGRQSLLGLSEAARRRFRKAHATHPITALQTDVLALDPRSRGRRRPGGVPRARNRLRPTARSGAGFLTGQITSPDGLAEDDWRRTTRLPRGELPAQTSTWSSG